MTRLHLQTGHLHPTPPFSFARTLGFLAGFAPTQGEQAVLPQTLTKSVSVGGQVVAFRLSAGGTVEEPLLHYSLFSEQQIGEDTERVVLERINLYLSLDDDLKPFYELGSKDPDFAPIVERLYGYHQVKFLSAFECGCWAVLTQRNAMPTARKMKAELARRYGGSIEIEGATHWAFPEPDRLAAVPPEELGAIAGNERKGEYMSALARAFSSVSEEFLRSAPYEQTEAWLRGIKGVGEWSATFIMLRGLGRTERVPFSERRVVEAAFRVYARGRFLREEDIRRIAEGYGPWQGYWAHYLRAASQSK